MQNEKFNLRSFLVHTGINRGIPASTTELNVPLGHIKIRFQITGRLTIKERRVIALVIYRQLRPLFNCVHFHIIRHRDSNHLNELRDTRKGIKTRLALQLDTEINRAGFLIRMKRLEYGWTQEICAEKLVLDRGHVSKLERGLCKMTPATRIKVEQILNLELSDS